MDEIAIDTRIDAPPAAVREVLDDYGSIDGWSPGVRRSVLESKGPIGVGTTRHCDFKPFGSAKETIEEYVPGRRMRVRLDQVRGMPISAAEGVFDLESVPGGTRVDFGYSYAVARRARLLRGLLPRLLRGGLSQVLNGLKLESEQLAAAP